MPSHHTIMRGDERSPSNVKGLGAKCGVFMTPTMSHRVGQSKQGRYTPTTRVGKKKACPFTSKKEWGDAPQTP